MQHNNSSFGGELGKRPLLGQGINQGAFLHGSQFGSAQKDSANERLNNIILVNNAAANNNNNQFKQQNINQQNTNIQQQMQIIQSSQDLNQFEQSPGFSTDIYPIFDKNANYYQEFWRVYLQNEILISQMKEQVNEIKNIKMDVIQLEQLCKQLEQHQSESQKPNKKKNRRVAADITKDFTCPYENCGKSYGSDVSLNLHIKLKHGGGNKTEREKLARNIYLAQTQGDKLPDINLNLPPGYLDKFKSDDKKQSHKTENSQGIDSQQNDLSDQDEIDEDNLLQLNNKHIHKENPISENSINQKEENNNNNQQQLQLKNNAGSVEKQQQQLQLKDQQQ